jgi:muramoyltetrapeptide carboxypeptidase
VAGTGGGGFFGVRLVTRALLSRGEHVGVVATGFAPPPDALGAGVAALERRGFVPVLFPHVLAVDGYFAGSDALRLADLDAAVCDPALAAIWFARGGYGTARILDRFDLKRLLRHPKLLVGYSDLTALFSAVLSRAATVCLHGPMVAELGRKDAFHAPSLQASLAGRTTRRRVLARDVLSPGRARGRLMGGNLTVLCHLLGTRHMPNLSGAILFLEETGEEAYRVDRLFQHLVMSGALSGVRAVVLGTFHVPKTARVFPGDRELDAVLREHLLPLAVPVVSGVPSGHGPGKWTLPLGGTCSLDTVAGSVSFDPRPAPLPSRKG